MRGRSDSTILIFFRLLIIILLAFSFVECLIHATGFGKADYKDLTSVTATVKKKGRSETISASMQDLPPLDAGDRLDFYIKLPEQSIDELDLNWLCFWQYHSIVRIYGSDGSLLYHYGDEDYKKGHMLGDEYCTAEIPRYCFGRTIHIRVDQVQAYSSSHITKFRLMKAKDVRLYPLIGNRLNFSLYGTLLLVSVFVFTISIVRRFGSAFGNNVSLTSITLSVFVFAVSTWQMSSRRMFYVLIQNRRICAVTEYFMILFLPIPLYLFLAEISTRRLKRIYRLIAAFFIVYAAINLILHCAFHSLIVSRESQLHVFLGASCILVVISELLLGHKSNNPQVSVYRQTIMIAIMFLLFALGVLTLRLAFPRSRILIKLQNIDFSSMSAYAFLAGMTLALFMRFLHTTSQRAKEEQNEFLAYHDLLTQIYNRAYCEEVMDAISHELSRTYAVIFFDVDHLKEANDIYGHKVGDLLIKTAADTIQKVVPEDGSFACRWGGDEFLIVLTNPVNIVKTEQNLENEINQVNEKKIVPFPFSISYGHAIHYSNATMSFADIRGLADQRMYVMKQKKHAERT
jgi:diguanylate cyclase (GGDEF)-like protein